MEEIKNEKENVLKDKCMCEEDIINDILMCEKNISDNYSIACNEMSNKYLYKMAMVLYDECKDMARELYNYAFSKGWYSIKTANESDINKTYTDYKNKLKELS